MNKYAIRDSKGRKFSVWAETLHEVTGKMSAMRRFPVRWDRLNNQTLTGIRAEYGTIGNGDGYVITIENQ